jgi:hypothetical protein
MAWRVRRLGRRDLAPARSRRARLGAGLLANGRTPGAASCCYPAVGQRAGPARADAAGTGGWRTRLASGSSQAGAATWEGSLSETAE